MICSMGGYAQPLNPPQITCTELNNNGDVTVSWIPVSDLNNEFTHYEIMASAFTGGPFAPVGTATNLSDNSFSYNTGVTPPTAPVYFQIITHSSDGINSYSSAASLVVGTIFLTAVPSTNPLGYATLNWNSPYPTNTPPPAGIQYEVWMEKGGVWSMIQTLPFGVTNWSYEIKEMCDELLNFQIRLSIPAGCEFLSNTPGAIFRDLISPDIPVISSVSVDVTTAFAIITWEPSLADDTKGYLLYNCQGSNPPTTTLIATLYGQFTNQYTDMLPNTAIGPVQYAIAAFDSCYMLTPPMVPASPIGPCNKSIYLQLPSYTNCDDFIRLNWQNYEGWQFGIDSYTVYHGFSVSPPGLGNPITYSPIATVSGNITTYTHFGIPQQDGYNSYYIEGTASQTGFIATSNLQNVYVTYPTAPDFVYVGAASVWSKDSTKITLTMDPTAFPHEFRLQRFGINSNEWIDVAVQNVSSSSQIEFFDSGLATDVFSYDYRVIVRNGCGDIVDTTNLGRTILTDAVANKEMLRNIITWSAYIDWETGVEKYNIYREIDDNGTVEWIGELGGTANRYYEDDVSQMLFTEGKFCYIIEAIEAGGSSVGVTHTALSNEVCVNQDPVIWIPNSFLVGGHNNTFRPVISFADFDFYQMVIFSRWGDIVYETTDINAPWDGSFKGHTAQEGAYVYFITIKDGLGRAIEKRGYVNLLVHKGR